MIQAAVQRPSFTYRGVIDGVENLVELSKVYDLGGPCISGGISLAGVDDVADAVLRRVDAGFEYAAQFL